MAGQQHRENNMHHTLRCLVLLALSLTLTCSAAPSGDTNTPMAGKAKITRPKHPKPARDTGPAETRAERDKRLQRECRGKPNAGACEGYGS